MSKQTKIKKTLLIIIFYATGLAFLMTTNPKKLPSVLLVLPFIFLFLGSFTVVLILLKWLARSKPNLFGVRLGRPKLMATLLVGFPVLLLILQSIGQLTTKDTLTAVAIFVVAYFYVIKSSVSFPER